jgi:hypothetical protein
MTNHYNDPGAQPLMLPVDPVLVDPEIGMEPLLRPVVSSPQQVSASKKRRRKAVLGKFVCQLCSQDFTAKHNLQSQPSISFSLSFSRL